MSISVCVCVCVCVYVCVEGDVHLQVTLFLKFNEIYLVFFHTLRMTLLYRIRPDYLAASSYV